MSTNAVGDAPMLILFVTKRTLKLDDIVLYFVFLIIGFWAVGET